MSNQTEALKNIYKEVFTQERLRTDLVYYLNEAFAENEIRKINGDEYIVEVFNEEINEIEYIHLSENDRITVILYRSVFMFDKDFYYEVVMGLGNYIGNKVSDSFFEIEKCLVRMKYNYDLSLYDAEFYITEINKIR